MTVMFYANHSRGNASQTGPADFSTHVFTVNILHESFRGVFLYPSPFSPCFLSSPTAHAGNLEMFEANRTLSRPLRQRSSRFRADTDTLAIYSGFRKLSLRVDISFEKEKKKNCIAPANSFATRIVEKFKGRGGA